MFPRAYVSRADWIRTSDLYTPSVARYQTTLQPEELIVETWPGVATTLMGLGRSLFS